MPSKDDSSPPPPPGPTTPLRKDEPEDRVTGQDVKACFKISETKPHGDYRWHCLSCSALGWATPSAISHLKSCSEALKRPEVQRVLRLYKPRYRKTTPLSRLDEVEKDGSDIPPGTDTSGDTVDGSPSKRSRISSDPNKITGKDVRSCMKVNGEKKPNGDYRWTCVSCSMSGWSTAEAVTHLKGCKEALKRPEVQRVIEGYKPRSQRQPKAPRSEAAEPLTVKLDSRTRKKRTFKEVKQTDLTANRGNSLQACVASVLGLDLDEVPNFIESSGDIYDSLREFLGKRSLGFMKIALDSNGCLTFAPAAKKTLCLLAGDSPRPNQRHVVVGEIDPGAIKAKIIWDPHPTRDGLKTQTWVGLFVALDPANVE